MTSPPREIPFSGDNMDKGNTSIYANPGLSGRHYDFWVS